MVFEWRAGKNNPVFGLQHAGGLVALRCKVFDILRFVEKGVMKEVLPQVRDVIDQRMVSGDDEVIFFEPGDCPQSVRAMK
jgi:hypothetical protein